VQRKTEGGCLDLASRADPTPSSKSGVADVGPYLISSRSRQIPAGGRIFGTMPRIIDRPIEGAGNSRQDDVRKGSAQEMRGLGQAAAVGTVR